MVEAPQMQGGDLFQRPSGPSLFDPELGATACGGPAKQLCARLADRVARSPAGQWVQRQAAQLGPRLADVASRITQRAPKPNITADLERLLRPGGKWIGEAGARTSVRIVRGGADEAKALFEQLTRGGRPVPGKYPGTLRELPGGGT